MPTMSSAAIRTVRENCRVHLLNSPSCGAKNTASVNCKPAATAIMPAALVLSSNAAILPTMADTIATAIDQPSIGPNRSLNNRAVAAGTISMATTTIEPSASKAVTAEAATNAISRKWTTEGRIPMAAAKPESIDVTRKAFQAPTTNREV